MMMTAIPNTFWYLIGKSLSDMFVGLFSRVSDEEGKFVSSL